MAASPPIGRVSHSLAADDAAAVIARYEARIPELMAEQGIPGIAVALVDGDGVLWTEGFGHVDGDASAAITADTMFSVQSMSKLFTATAVMVAVEDGRVDLDEPITTYVPEFTVNSAFEDQPERRITLRMLLSHTAGFTHEAPIGNNFEIDPGSFDDHVRSISTTWLRFPVGTGYAYSNLGIDLAGFILERVYGSPFAAVMRDLVLGPLGMDHSSFDRGEISANDDRALGHAGPAPEVPVIIPMTAAGGLYTSARDLARFLRFQLSAGSLDGRDVLNPASIDEMRTIPEPHAGDTAGYALGLGRTRWIAGGNADLFSHGGGGFGFLSDLWWAPQLDVGVAVLTNSADHDLQVSLALSILSDLVHEPGSVYHERLLALPAQGPPVESDGAYQPPSGMRELIADAAMTPLGDEGERWTEYTDTYRTASWGVLDPMNPPDRFFVDSGVPYFETSEAGAVARHRLTEIEAGIFLAEDGETLDLRGSPATWRGLELVPVTGGPAPWQWLLLVVVSLGALGWLIGAVASALRRRSRVEGTDERPGRRGLRMLAAAVAAITALLALATVALVAAIPALVDSGFLGWLELPAAERLVLHLPLIFAMGAGGTLVLCAFGWAGDWWAGSARLRYAALAVASIALAGQLAAWGLIGWGLA